MVNAGQYHSAFPIPHIKKYFLFDLCGSTVFYFEFSNEYFANERLVSGRNGWHPYEDFPERNSSYVFILWSRFTVLFKCLL